MTRAFFLLLLLGASFGVAGCNQTMGGAVAGPAVGTPVARSAFRLPPDAPCSNEINQYHSIVKADLETGNVEQKVYDQIETELNRAASACSAGKGGEAHALVAGSKARHGYRA